MPSLRFLHFVRDGRDMAFSKNQQQLMKHGTALLPATHLGKPEPDRSIALWAKANLAAADFGESKLAGRYIRIRFEDLCGQPVETVQRILEFFGLRGDPVKLAIQEVKPPATLRRWRFRSQRVVSGLERIAAEALERFGYLE